MNFTMISPRHNHDNGYISLVNINLLGLPDTVSVDNYELFKKSEFHISLIATKYLAPLINSGNPERADRGLEKNFLDFLSENDLTEFELTGEHRLVKRDERVTTVVMVDVANIDKLFDELREKYKVDLPTQPTHITLHTLQPEAGIGLLSDKELARDSKSVDIPVLNGVRVEE